MHEFSACLLFHINIFRFGNHSRISLDAYCNGIASAADFYPKCNRDACLGHYFQTNGLKRGGGYYACIFSVCIGFKVVIDYLNNVGEHIFKCRNFLRNFVAPIS